MDNVIDLSDSSNEDVLMQKVVVHDSALLFSSKSYIKHELKDQHRHLCLQYRNASSMEEAEIRYLAIKAWWASLNVQVRTV